MLVAKRLSHTTKMEAIRVLGSLPPGAEDSQCMLERHLAHMPKNFSLPTHTSDELSHFVAVNRCCAKESHGPRSMQIYLIPYTNA